MKIYHVFQLYMDVYVENVSGFELLRTFRTKDGAENFIKSYDGFLQDEKWLTIDELHKYGEFDDDEDDRFYELIQDIYNKEGKYVFVYKDITETPNQQMRPIFIDGKPVRAILSDTVQMSGADEIVLYIKEEELYE